MWIDTPVGRKSELVVPNFVAKLHIVRGLPGLMTDDHHVQRRTKRPHVSGRTAIAHGRLQQNFGCLECGRSFRYRQRVAFVDDARGSEIANLDEGPILVEQNVLRFQIPEERETTDRRDDRELSRVSISDDDADERAKRTCLADCQHKKNLPMNNAALMHVLQRTNELPRITPCRLFR